MKALRAEIYNFLNEHTAGVLLTPDQPLEEAAHRILETFAAMSAKSAKAENRASVAEAERDDAEGELADLRDSIKEKTSA